MGFNPLNEKEIERVTPNTWPGKIQDVRVEIDPRTSEPMGCGLLSLALGCLLLLAAITWYAMDAGDHELLKIILGIVGGGLLGSVLGKVRMTLRRRR